jgi:Fe-S cluster assembly ATP-binding protein
MSEPQEERVIATEPAPAGEPQKQEAGLLEVRGLAASVEGKQILRGVDLTVRQGEVHALMGPNGSGKSTLAYTLMGHPKYEVTGGTATYRGEDLLELSPDERARAGIFLSFQYPTAIPGVTLHNFLRTATKAVRGDELPPREFRRVVTEQMERLKMDPSFATRYVNDGFSGGEKKRAEILQLGVLRPQIAILDETDSGLDIDALRTVAEGVEALRGPDLGVLLITHYQRILNYVRPDFVHVLYRGRVVRSGGPELAEEIEVRGYDWIISELGETPEAELSGSPEISPAERAFAEAHHEA